MVSLKRDELFIELDINKSKIIFDNIYRPPSRGVNNFTASQQTDFCLDIFSGILNQIADSNLQCFLAVDFNFCLLKHHQSSHVSDFINRMFSGGMINLRGGSELPIYNTHCCHFSFGPQRLIFRDNLLIF